MHSASVTISITVLFTVYTIHLLFVPTGDHCPREKRETVAFRRTDNTKVNFVL